VYVNVFITFSLPYRSRVWTFKLMSMPHFNREVNKREVCMCVCVCMEMRACVTKIFIPKVI